MRLILRRGVTCQDREFAQTIGGKGQETETDGVQSVL